MFDAILHSHLKRYPEMQIQDVYKLVHQSSLGAGHAVTNPLSARAWLERELAEMGKGPSEPMLDPISADGQLLRVHLRPYAAAGGATEMLLDAFIRTANEFWSQKESFEANWDIVARTRLFPAALLDDFIAPVRTDSYPSVHHTDIYKRLYKPAYRVVLRKYLSFGEIGE